jgi:hypothetical protein
MINNDRGQCDACSVDLNLLSTYMREAYLACLP